MLIAQLKHKLPSELWITSEDLLTSAVFGTLKNLPDSFAIDLISRARALDDSSVPSLQAPLEWGFWPWWDTCEPDVVIQDSHTFIVCEVKLFADFGEDVGAGRQLRREWRDGVRRADAAGKELFLLTVTNQASPPLASLRHQLSRTTAPNNRVCWLSWLDVASFMAALQTNPVAGGWATDLSELLDRMNLRPFRGFHTVVSQARALAVGLQPWSLVPPQAPIHSIEQGFEPSISQSLFGTATWLLIANPTEISAEDISGTLHATHDWLMNGAVSWKLM